MERANRRYILTQGPLAFTVGHFWLMIWEQNTKAILMLNKVIEKNEIKCHWYWPQGIGETHKMTFNDVQLAVVLEKEEDCCYYSTRQFKLYDLESGESRDVMQYHYTTWPDFGVPTSPNAFLQFLKRVRESGVLDPTDGPPVIHCSAGIGRSGTFCLVDCCLVIRDEDEREDSIYAVVGEEEAPPPPPPRAESLTRAPGRPLPAIPVSESLGNLNFSQQDSSSDESPPTPPSRDNSLSASSADDEDDEPTAAVAERYVSDMLRRAMRCACIQNMRNLGLNCQPLSPRDTNSPSDV
ncbi:hypothetical protein HF086_000634 [Spodoptera exigua]|uniref:protein-tyrosine-phosphatase n=1 Tax=Spodoptera exigua TaxID=7107 RepID=A0A922MD07_SPOEX|nr:hypothetical protein HF086_000634 [Spodoptera exigua]